MVIVTRLILLLLLTSTTPDAWAAITVTDDTGRRVTLPDYPRRIVSLAPGATEMLFAAGAGGSIIATSEYSDEPAAARRIPRIGDAFAIDMERLAAARPDVVVVWPGGNNPAQIATVERLGIPIYHQRVDRLADMPASLRRLGRLANTIATAEQAARDIEARLERLQRHYAGRPEVSVFLQVWDRPVYTIGGTQLISDALRLCGARNIFADLREPGPAVDIEAVLARNPEIIVAIGREGASRRWIEDWKRFASLRAVRAGRLAALDDPRLTKMGPSAVQATEALCQVIDAHRPRASQRSE